MNINKLLLEAANLNPTKNSRQEYIFTLCEYIEKNELTLPLYQRDVSWTLAKCVELLNYQLLSKSPISAISINIINNTEKEFAVPQMYLYHIVGTMMTMKRLLHYWIEQNTM